MKTYRRWWQAILAALPLVLTITAWVVFAPIRLGGQATYVIVNGNSMEPNFHLGDLVIVRQENTYQVGDIVVYRSAELKGFVFHRIIGLNLDHFVLKGDNNSWTDSYQPTQSELLGKLWIYIPKAGNIVKWLRTPIVMAALAAVVGIVLLVILMASSKRGQTMNKRIGQESPGKVRTWVDKNFATRFKGIVFPKLSRQRQSGAITSAATLPQGSSLPHDKQLRELGPLIEALFFILGFVALAALVLGIFAFTHPIWQEVADNVEYQQTGMFSYSTTAPAGVYDTTSVSSGDPLFPKLNCEVNLQFSYFLSGDQLQGLAGTHQLTAIIQEKSSGWQRTLPLESQTAFSGNTFVTLADLDLCQVEAIVADMEEATDLHSSSYSLVIDPHVAIGGQVAGRDLQAAFDPALVFQFDQVHFYLYQGNETTDPLNPSETGIIEGTRQALGTFSLFGLGLQVGESRVLALVGLGLSLAGLLVIGLFVASRTQRSQEALVQVKYGPMLVDIQDRMLESSLPAIDVMTMDDLAKLAERNNSVILHQARGMIHYYFVQGDRITYRFALSEDGSSPTETAPQQLEENLRLGIERGEFQVYYQPIVSLPDGKITAVEALLRWQHPDRGLVSATDFISTAERSGLIDRIGEWMLQAACAQFEQWQKAGIQVKLAVNLSERQLEKAPADIILRVLEKTGVDPRALQIEIPEASLVANAPAVLPNLQKLSELGLQLSLDDFSGNSPLSSLAQFRISSVKIDRRVVGRISDPQNALVVSDMISAVQNLGLSVVAEGVETEDQLAFLQDKLCTLAQGYLLGRPVPAEEVTRLLEKAIGSDQAKRATRRSGSEEKIG